MFFVVGLFIKCEGFFVIVDCLIIILEIFVKNTNIAIHQSYLIRIFTFLSHQQGLEIIIECFLVFPLILVNHRNRAQSFRSVVYISCDLSDLICFLKIFQSFFILTSYSQRSAYPQKGNGISLISSLLHAFNILR